MDIGKAYNKFQENYVCTPLAYNFHLIEAYCGLSGGWFSPACWLAGWLASWLYLQLVNVDIHPSPHLFLCSDGTGWGCLAGSIVGATDAPAFQRTIRKLIIKDFDDAMMTTTALTSRGSIKNPYSYHAICTWIVSVRYILQASEWRHCLLI